MTNATPNRTMAKQCESSDAPRIRVQTVKKAETIRLTCTACDTTVDVTIGQISGYPPNASVDVKHKLLMMEALTRVSQHKIGARPSNDAMLDARAYLREPEYKKAVVAVTEYFDGKRFEHEIWTVANQTEFREVLASIKKPGFVCRTMVAKPVKPRKVSK